MEDITEIDEDISDLERAEVETAKNTGETHFYNNHRPMHVVIALTPHSCYSKSPQVCFKGIFFFKNGHFSDQIFCATQ